MADPQHPDHPAARLVRASRAYSGLSRVQLGRAAGVDSGTIGRWERGQWKSRPPKAGLIDAVIRAAKLDEIAELIDDVRASTSLGTAPVATGFPSAAALPPPQADPDSTDQDDTEEETG